MRWLGIWQRFFGNQNLWDNINHIFFNLIAMMPLKLHNRKDTKFAFFETMSLGKNKQFQDVSSMIFIESLSWIFIDCSMSPLKCEYHSPETVWFLLITCSAIKNKTSGLSMLTKIWFTWLILFSGFLW